MRKFNFQTVISKIALTALLLEGRAPTSCLVTGKPLFKPTEIPVEDIVIQTLKLYEFLGVARQKGDGANAKVSICGEQYAL